MTIIEGPVAVIDAPGAIPISETASFDASGSYMDDGNITGWHWDFGDGAFADGAKATHRYVDSGAYTVTLTLTSDSPSPTCQRIAAQHRITVNAPPVADAGVDRHTAIGEPVAFDASASRDVDGGIVSYLWDFGDGTTADGVEVRHAFRAAGTYEVTLTVRDEADLANSSATDTLAVTVNPGPAPSVDGPAVACVGETATWRPAGDAGDSRRSFAWSFGNGVRADGDEAAHAYTRPGRYSLVLLADDGLGHANSRQQTTHMVHVNEPPHAEAGPDRMTCPGDRVVFDGSASRDPDGRLVAWRWDFGDGAAYEGRQVEHAYENPGTYEVTLTVVDDTDSKCSTKTDTMTVVVNAPPVADAGGDREVWVGGANDAVLLDGSASFDPDGQALSHAWQIGETVGEIGERVRHALTAAGDVPVTLTVSDASGLACGSASTTVHLKAKQR